MSKSPEQQLADFWQELSDNGNGFTYNGLNSTLNDLNGPNLFSIIEGTFKHYKINPPKPKKQIIDLSVCIDSGIDMEFTDDNNVWKKIEKLKNIDNNYYTYVPFNNPGFKYCRVRQNYYHGWKGGECPLPEGLEVKLYFNDSISIVTSNIQHLCWDSSSQNRIIGFEVLGTAENFRYKWEKE